MAAYRVYDLERSAYIPEDDTLLRGLHIKEGKAYVVDDQLRVNFDKLGKVKDKIISYPHIRSLAIYKYTGASTLRAAALKDILLRSKIKDVELPSVYRYSEAEITLIGEGLAGSEHIINLELRSTLSHRVIQNMNSLCRGLALNKSIRKLKIFQIKLSNTDVECLSRSLLKNKTLRNLILETCEITEIGAKYLAEVLEHNSSLRNLDLTHNNIGEGGIYLANTIAKNDSLTEINLTWNNLSSDGIIKMLSGLELNDTLECINLTQNYFPGDLFRRFITSKLAHQLNNTSIKKINLNLYLTSQIKRVDLVADDLYFWIKDNKTLEHLVLPLEVLGLSYTIETTDGSLGSRVTKRNSDTQSVDEKSIDRYVVDKICEGIAFNYTLKSIKFYHGTERIDTPLTQEIDRLLSEDKRRRRKVKMQSLTSMIVETIQRHNISIENLPSGIRRLNTLK